MKKLFLLLAGFGMLTAGCSDSYDDSELVKRMDEFEQRLQKLEQLCNSMNTNLSSMQSIVTALEKGDYITSVEPLTENGAVVGYTIKFAKSTPIVIYHGEDGASPVIAIKQDTDGIYYWTLNGEWLIDAGGGKLPVAGKDGMTPKLKIEEEYWYISYDDGKTWTKLDKATGDGIQIEMDENYVYFILPDGTKITVPTVKPFDMTLSGAEPQSFTIDIKARDGQQNYYVGVTTRTEFEKLESPAAVAEAFIQLEEQNGQVDWSVADGQLVHKGDKSIEAGDVWNLKPKTEYAVMVFGVTAEGALATDPVYGFIATTEVQPSTNRISITVEPGTALVKVQTTNSDPYFLNCIEADRIEGYPLDQLAQHMIGIYGMALDQCIETGNVERDFTSILDEDTDYCAVAFGCVAGYPTTDVVVVEFHTPGGELVPQDCTFESQVTDLNATGGTVTVIPSNPETTYFWQVYNKVLVDSYADKGGAAALMNDGLAIIAEALSERYEIEITVEAAAGMVTTTGTDRFTYFEQWDPDTEYCVVAVGLDDKARQTTDVYVSEPFRTPAESTVDLQPMACTITLNAVTEEGLNMTVVPEDKQMTYVGMVGEADFLMEYPSDNDYLIDDLAMWKEMASAETMSAAEMFDMLGLFLQGDQTFTIPSLELGISFDPGTTYVAYAYGLSEADVLTTGMQSVFFTVDESGTITTVAAPTRPANRPVALPKTLDRRFAGCRPATAAARPAMPDAPLAKRNAATFE